MREGGGYVGRGSLVESVGLQMISNVHVQTLQERLSGIQMEGNLRNGDESLLHVVLVESLRDINDDGNLRDTLRLD